VSTDPLRAVADATRARDEGTAQLDAAWVAAIRAAVEAGESQAAVARAAGVSREWVNKLLREAR
jgi:DNA-binding phage protein